MLQNLIRDLGLPCTIAQAGGTREQLEDVVAASAQAALALGLTSDLPDGELSIRGILESAWA